MRKRYIVKLTPEERKELKSLIKRGKGAAYKIKHANILLKVDSDGPQWTDTKTAEAFSVHLNTVVNVRQRYVELGFEGALERKKMPPRDLKLDGKAEAHLIAMNCGNPPEGYGNWSLRLLADKMVTLSFVESVSHETIRRTLKKTS